MIECECPVCGKIFTVSELPPVLGICSEACFEVAMELVGAELLRRGRRDLLIRAAARRGMSASTLLARAL